MKNIVLITGASSGIGKSCAVLFARHGYDIILIARRQDVIGQLAEELEKKFQVSCYPLQLDVRNRKDVHKAIDSLPDEWKNISLLINNAGLALGLSPIDQGEEEDWNVMIDTNIKGLLWMTRAVLPLMKRHKRGQIINIGSIAGREVYPKGNIYCSTKYAVDALTKAMRTDLLNDGIRVTQVSPGAVKTEFSKVRYKGNDEKAETVYEGYTPLTPDDVAEVIYFCASRPPHVNINDVLVMPTDQASAGVFNKNL